MLFTETSEKQNNSENKMQRHQSLLIFYLTHHYMFDIWFAAKYIQCDSLITVTKLTCRTQMYQLGLYIKITDVFCQLSASFYPLIFIRL